MSTENLPEIKKATLWWRNNKERANAAYLKRKGTIDGKLISLVTQSKYRSKLANRDHDLDTAYLRDLYLIQDGKCALSGLSMSIIGKRGTPEYWNSISLDRINSSLGYIKGNVQLVCTGVNYMKKDMSDEQFISFCKEVARNQK